MCVCVCLLQMKSSLEKIPPHHFFKVECRLSFPQSPLMVFSYEAAGILYRSCTTSMGNKSVTDANFMVFKKNLSPTLYIFRPLILCYSSEDFGAKYKKAKILLKF